jgi:tripartite-type tricarboxylate transporter receptor subunit TctC
LAANPNVAMAQLAGLPQVRFDIQQFEWLGSSGSDGALFSIRADLPYKTFKEFKDSGRELIAGTTGPGSNAYDMPLLLKEFAGANLKLLKGYAANSDILLAIERKEVDAYAALGTTIKLAVDRGAVRALVRARAPVSGFNDLPIDEDLTTDPVGKSLMAIRGIPLLIGRPFAVRPGTPADRVAILRDALAKAMADPELLAEAKKAQIEINYISGPEVTKSFHEMMNQPPQVIEAMKKYLTPGE